MYVSFSTGDVAVIDGLTNTVIATIPILDCLRSVAVNPVTNRIYVIDCSTTVYVIDGATNSVIATVPVGGGAQGPSVGVAVNPVTNRIYENTLAGVVATNGVLSVIDGATNTVTATITVGDDPFGVAVNTTVNRIYVANVDSHDVYVVDGATNTVLTTVPGGGITSYVAANSQTNRVYVTDMLLNHVLVIQDPDAGTPGLGHPLRHLGIPVR